MSCVSAWICTATEEDKKRKVEEDKKRAEKKAADDKRKAGEKAADKRKRQMTEELHPAHH
jgi:hypothetical protein